MIDGIIGRKKGMAQVFNEDRSVVQVTAIEAGPCFIAQVKRVEKEGYDAVQLGFGEAKRLNQPEKGHLKKVGLLKHLREFRVTDTSSVEVGQKIDVSIFKPGDIVDVVGISKGRGFAGTIKRHNFSGGPKTHGQSDRHRAPGSIGSTATPGRVFKGKKMAGHMGDERVTVRGLKVVQADVDRNLLLVKGAVPGAKEGILLIKKSSKNREAGA
ncbi:MAG: 50S ribosomal protein L3 [Chloroflexota bacterium]|nr:50S ribosomal protein L3 [Chloroflexota bacterium]